MYLWQRLVTPHWLAKNEETLRSRLGQRVAVIARPNQKRLQVEAASGSRAELRGVTREFGGRVKKLPANWLQRFSRAQNAGTLKIGNRLIIVRSPGKREADGFPCRLVIPVGAAFGTGEHATTAMSLRLLEQTTRAWKAGWSLADIGTGTGILALAAKSLGANRVVGIDLDPMATSTARENARLNRIKNVRFECADVRSWKFGYDVDMVAANLFSELLIEILPRLKRSRRLILSGVLRVQEPELTRALRRNGMDVKAIKRRGKWIAILAATR
jgi:ribosomal protein L11 methyltransferase